MGGERRARFEMGQVVDHRLFGYRGVIYDVDPTFQQSEEWYETVAKSRPPKDRPWYHVLPDGAAHSTYVAERNLETATEPTPVHHSGRGDLRGLRRHHVPPTARCGLRAWAARPGGF